MLVHRKLLKILGKSETYTRFYNNANKFFLPILGPTRKSRKRSDGAGIYANPISSRFMLRD